MNAEILREQMIPKNFCLHNENRMHDGGLIIYRTHVHYDIRNGHYRNAISVSLPTCSSVRLSTSTNNRPPTIALNSTMLAPSIQALKTNIVNLAYLEWERWGRGNIKEGNPQILEVLRDYWQTGVGVGEHFFQKPNWISDKPWSAAFISWIMRKAGAGDAFRYSGSHSVYIKAAKDNRLTNNNNPFKAYRTTEIVPQIGDLVCKARANSGATYDNIRPGFKTHCDIVTRVYNNQLETIGGNVDNSVSLTPVQIDNAGYIIRSGRNRNYFAIIRIG